MKKLQWKWLLCSRWTSTFPAKYLRASCTSLHNLWKSCCA